MALNCDTLKSRREQKYLDAYVIYFDENQGLLVGIAEQDEIKSILQKIIEGKQTPDENGLLEPFFFVEIAFLQSLQNGIKG